MGWWDLVALKRIGTRVGPAWVMHSNTHLVWWDQQTLVQKQGAYPIDPEKQSQQCSRVHANHFESEFHLMPIDEVFLISVKMGEMDKKCSTAQRERSVQQSYLAYKGHIGIWVSNFLCLIHDDVTPVMVSPYIWIPPNILKCCHERVSCAAKAGRISCFQIFLVDRFKEPFLSWCLQPLTDIVQEREWNSAAFGICWLMNQYSSQSRGPFFELL